MTPTSASSSARDKRAKFTPQAIDKIKELVAQGASRDEIANSLAVTVGSLQVTCSRLGISLRRRDASGPGGPRTVRPPYLPSHPPIAGQRHTGTGFQITLTLECNGTRRTTELPLTRSAIVQLKLEAEMRNLSMGQLLAGCQHGDQKGDDRRDFYTRSVLRRCDVKRSRAAGPPEFRVSSHMDRLSAPRRSGA